MLDREAYDKFRVAAVDPAAIRCAEVEATLQKLVASSGGQIKVERFADSYLGRPIHLVTIGKGPRRVLLWSQMHGDEPTLTAVLLDLLSYLTRSPAEPLAADLLSGCTLMMIPMLNPDGAEVFTRYNAQGIDINRDARRLATPEARALRRAVETLKPEFGFNLHNQNARTTVGTPPRPAAVSVLAPPPDKARTETQAMLRGKKMCTCFVEAVRPHAEGMISRYDDTYEPRAFGDTIQAFGTATMLVEAGGWPDADYEPLTRLHFHGLLQTLHAIATDRYQQADVTVYESLPESNSAQPSDCIIRSATALDGRAGEVFKVDFTINHSTGARLNMSQPREGRIVEIGDLERERGRMTIDAGALLVLPGRIAFVKGFSPVDAGKLELFDRQLAAGVTTIVGAIDVTDRAQLEALANIGRLPTNVGFVAWLDGARKLSPGDLIERVTAAVSRGVWAVVGDAVDASVRQHCDWFGVPVLRPEQLAPPANSASYATLAAEAWKLYERLGLATGRGFIGRDAIADLQFFALDGPANAAAAPDWKHLERVMVSGETVWENGKRTSSTPGVLLRRR